MLIPLFVLAFGAVFAGILADHWFVGEGRGEFWKHSILVLPQHDSIAAAEHVSWIIDYLPLIAGLLGIAVAYVCYSLIPELPSRLAMRFRAIYLFLLNKWYFDELYDRLFVRTARNIALSTSLIVFVLSIALWVEFDPSTPAFQFVERARWVSIGGFTINYHLGIDGISLFFILLSTLLTVLCVLSSWNSVQVQVKEYMISFLVLETMMVGIFSALDFFLFYVFFEGVLIPMFLIIGVWGGPRRVYSAFKFFLYTLLGSVLSLLAIIAVYVQTGSSDIEVALAHHFPPDLQKWLWLAFFASFAVKVPMWPVHTWLPDAHVEAPTAGSAILAGVLLKLGRSEERR